MFSPHTICINLLLLQSRFVIVSTFMKTLKALHVFEQWSLSTFSFRRMLAPPPFLSLYYLPPITEWLSVNPEILCLQGIPFYRENHNTGDTCPPPPGTPECLGKLLNQTLATIPHPLCVTKRAKGALWFRITLFTSLCTVLQNAINTDYRCRLIWQHNPIL